MGFLRTPDELADMRQRLTAPRFWGERITVEFTTSPETYAGVLPPLMTPLAQPLVVAGIGLWDSNCVGPYCGGSISLVAEHEGITGGVALGMWMDSEPAVGFGRDVLGEPKKLAQTGFARDGDHVRAWIERHGVRIIEIEAELGDDEGPSHVDRHSFNYRSRSAVDGYTLEGPAILTRTRFATRIDVRRRATATLTLRSSPHDPAGDIEIVQIIGAEYQRHELACHTEEVGQVDPDKFLPFHHGRGDVMALLGSSNVRAQD